VKSLYSSELATSPETLSANSPFFVVFKLTINSADLDALKNYVSLLIKEGRNSKDQLVALARYCRFAKKNDYFVYRARFIEELTGYLKRGAIWYEQEITPEVLELVKGNQEIQNGVRHGDKIYVSKIPFAPKQYLTEKDPVMKRYHACHCQLVRTAIRDGKPKISPVFCYGSGGYEKLPYDVIFDEPVKIELLESALKGDMRCRFAIIIPEGKMK